MIKHAVLLMLTIITFSCAEKQQEPDAPLQTPAQIVLQKTKEIAAPYIANEIGNLNINMETVRNTDLTELTREAHLDAIAHDEPEYLGRLTMATINTPEGEALLSAQKELITAKWMKQAAQLLYKQSLENQILTNGK